MGLFKNILLGSGAAVVSVAAAQAADLPVRKAAPVEYVRVCDAYGAGFFFIPGTDTCIRITGRLRADYAVVGTGDIYSRPGTHNTRTTTVYSLNTRRAPSRRGPPPASPATPTRSSASPRTPEPDGLGSACAHRLRRPHQHRLGRRPGRRSAPPVPHRGVLTGAGTDVASTATGTTLETAYIRFAGFTFGAARDSPPTAGVRLTPEPDGLGSARPHRLDVRTNTALGRRAGSGSAPHGRTAGALGRRCADSQHAAGVTLEAAYVRFAGFTFGAARDNFANMPSVMYMAAATGPRSRTAPSSSPTRSRRAAASRRRSRSSSTWTRRLARSRRQPRTRCTSAVKPGVLHRSAGSPAIRQQPAGQPVRGGSGRDRLPLQRCAAVQRPR